MPSEKALDGVWRQDARIEEEFFPQKARKEAGVLALLGMMVFLWRERALA
jgi:hypothetical protein